MFVPLATLGALLVGVLATEPAAAQSLAPLNRELPGWIALGGEYRTRFEGFTNRSYIEGNTDHYLLHRVRFDLRLQPAKAVRLVFQTQDSRVFFNSRVANLPPLQDSLDLRLAYVDTGDPEKSHLALRSGRQEISLGEERLLGNSNWGNTARSFDAVRLYWRPFSKARFDFFVSSVVAQTEGELDWRVSGDNMHGSIGQIDWRTMHFEPFILWRVAPRVRSESGGFGKLDSKTWGTRILGAAHGKRTSYVVELIGQNGTWGRDSLAGWAGHWRIVRTLSSSNWRIPRLRAEYDYATGDPDPTDGRHQTFELIYPTPHDKYGLADQVGWKNIHHLGAVAEWIPNANVTLQFKFHDWWLATPRDGVYNAGGTLIARDVTGQSGVHVGEEIDVQILTSFHKQWKLGGGIGHIFPGSFLRRTTPGRNFTFPYIMLTWAF